MKDDLVMESVLREWWKTFKLIPSALENTEDFKSGKLPKQSHMILDYLARLPYISSINTCFSNFISIN